MSSIYKKGRDGYYYYQTYVINKETGKKDRRIFHSLGTKNEDEALKKKAIYDNQYEKNQNHEASMLQQRTLFLLKSSFIGLIILLAIIYFPQKINKKTFMPTLPVIAKQNDSERVDNEKQSEKTLIKKNKISPKVYKNQNSISLPQKKEKENFVKNNHIEILTLPVFTIERVEEFPEAFNQIKIYVTVAKGIVSERLELLCEDISNTYSKYSNIIICLYSNSAEGKEIAKGKRANISNEEQIEIWLAMYTFNEVEGKYFNDNPTGYLGTIK